MLRSEWIKNDYIITVSYGNCCNGKGGTDKVMLSQQYMFHQMNLTTIHLWPCEKKKYGSVFLWKIAIDGQEKGVFSTEHFLLFLVGSGMKQKKLKAFLVHHLNGIDIEELGKLTKYLSCKKYFYLHDFYTICPYGGLAFNGQQYCSVGFPKKRKCEKCKFCSEEIEKRTMQIRQFIAEHKEFCYIAPSESAASIWLFHYPDCREKLRVVPHQILLDYYHEDVQVPEPEEELKIAYIGDQREIKGWPQWFEAVKTVSAERKNLSFYHFGRTETHSDSIKEIGCDFNENLNDMTIKLRKFRPDCVILWSQVPETYSYTYYEAFAANQFILAQEGSGNIEFQIRKNGNGYIVPKEKSLSEVLCNVRELTELIREYRQKKCAVPGKLEDNSLIPEEINRENGGFVVFQGSPIPLRIFLIEWWYCFGEFLNRMKLKIRNTVRRLVRR